MKFKINNTEWEIKEVDEATMNNEMKEDYTLGVTLIRKHEIWLVNNNVDMIRTLKHELTHAWLWEYGHNQHEKEFNSEDVCEIVASSNDFINEVVEQYKRYEPRYMCDAYKNIECKKHNCYLNGGACIMTTNKNYEKKSVDEH